MLYIKADEVYGVLRSAVAPLTAKEVTQAIFIDEDITTAMTGKVRLLLDQGTTCGYVFRDNSTATIRYKAGRKLTKVGPALLNR